MQNSQMATATRQNQSGGGSGSDFTNCGSGVLSSKAHSQNSGGMRVEAISSAMRNTVIVDGTSAGNLEGRASTFSSTAAGGEDPMQPQSRSRRNQRKLKNLNKPHGLPESGMAGMLKVLGGPAKMISNLRRGMDSVVGLAQCAACLVRHGEGLPVTSRVSRVWGREGEYQGSTYHELPIVDQRRAVPTPSAPVIRAAPVVGGVHTNRLSLPSYELGPSTTSEERRAFDANLTPQERKLNKKRERERERERERNRNREMSHLSQQRKLPPANGGDGGGGPRGRSGSDVSRGKDKGRDGRAPSQAPNTDSKRKRSKRGGRKSRPDGKQVEDSCEARDEARGSRQSGGGDATRNGFSGNSEGFDGGGVSHDGRHPKESGRRRESTEHTRRDREQRPNVSNDMVDRVQGGDGACGVHQNGYRNGQGQTQERGDAVPHWRGSVPVSSLSEDYLDYYVRERERKYYKSAGIIPYR